MSNSLFFLKAFFLFFYGIFSRKFANVLHRNVSFGRGGGVHRVKYQKFSSLVKNSDGDDVSDQTLVFNLEEAVLKSSSPYFSYFMLVSFEAGSIIRAMILLLSYPLVRLVGDEMGLKIMVMISFFGLKKESLRIGSAVLPKFFLNDVGLESFQVLMKRSDGGGNGKRVGVSNFPEVMIERLLRDYMEVDEVVGRKLKVVGGYFIGLMEDKRNSYYLIDQYLEKFHQNKSNVIGIFGFQKSYDFQFLSSICKEIYLVSKADKKKWKTLPNEKYPKPLIFHDGRLAFNPTLFNSLVLFIWFPFGFFLAILRALISLFLPYNLCIPINSFTGMHVTVSNPNHRSTGPSSIDAASAGGGGGGGLLYVCNHRTLLDPLFISAIFKKKFTAVTYSLSKVSELLSPIRTVRLRRNRDRDAKMMREVLMGGDDLIICPEGTTCREPYLLRFSPLFTELGANIVPVANDTHVSMFHGTTAGGFKCFDPLFFLMNPSPTYNVKVLDMVSESSSTRTPSCALLDDDENSISQRFDVANRVQSEIGKALNFECTKLTRKDKYLILAGNEGIVA